MIQILQFQYYIFIENAIEIETKPFVDELVALAYEPTQPSTSLPSTSNVKKQRAQHKCDICLHKFRTVAELNAHQQQGCERLIKVGLNTVDCQPTVVDFINSKYDEQIDENHIANDANLNVNEHTNQSAILEQPPCEAKKSFRRRRRKNERREQTGKRDFECALCFKS